jgi:hypothetical protein
MNKRIKGHYVDNKTFYAAMIEHKAKRLEAQKKQLPLPKISEYIGLCILQIATKLSTKGNFNKYTFKSEMISDGIENSILYLNNFNPDKSNNPFAYFTQIIYYAFIRRIQKEKKQVTIKHKMLLDSNFDDMALQPGEDREFHNQFTEFLKKNLPVEEPKIESLTTYREIKKEKLKKRKTRKGKLDYFIGL